MISYTYECDNDGTFTLDRSINDEPLKECPTCHGPIKQVFTKVTGIIVNCSGFCGKSGNS